MMNKRSILAEPMKPDFYCCLGVTDRCLLKCRMCYKWRDSPIEQYPSIGQYERFISDLAEFAGRNVKISFVGGEVLLFPGVLDLIKFSAEQGLWTHLASNGWLINEELAKRMADSGLSEVSLSLDSLNETVHDYLRGVKGVYRRVMDAIDYLRKYSKSIRINICCVIYDWNLDGLIPLLEWVNTNDKLEGVWFLAPMQPNGTSVENEWWKGNFSFLWPRDIDKACFIIDKLIEYKKSNAKIGNPISSLEEAKLYFRYRQTFEKKANCSLNRILEVKDTGQLFLCPKKDVAIGNIKDNVSLREILYSDEAKEALQKISLCREDCISLFNRFS